MLDFNTLTLIAATVLAGGSLIVTPIIASILGRQREKAIDAIAAFAAAGREPPPELTRVAANPLKVFG